MVLRHKGYGVYITCDGQRLAEYNIQIEDPLTISCYVPSEKGKVCTPPGTTAGGSHILDLCDSLGRRQTPGKHITSAWPSG